MEGQQPQGGAPAPQVHFDDAGLEPMYMNFCRVTGTPEEIILDFGLNMDPTPRANSTVKLTQRMVCNFYTAKRLLMALHAAVQRHEGAFGVLETDVQKRVRQRVEG
ncbi:MAG: DUF3467 domain-containing protein [Planctomycetia bacterium]